MFHDPERFLVIAGPCSLEGPDTCLPVAAALARLQEQHTDLQIVFKGSFDKANRTSPASNRGPGQEEGIALLERVKAESGLPVLTDIHLPDQAEPVAQVCDVLQIPAFLCRQTDLLVAAGATDSVVNVKKGQFLAPSDMQFAMDKVSHQQPSETWLTERGTTFGYGNLVVDTRSIAIMRQMASTVIIDASHGVQLPGAGGGESSGQREHMHTIAKAGIAAGANGLFLETHPDPANAISDKDSQCELREFPKLALSCLRLWRFLKED
jgi:2-dehydro-3-deoxyphosphooctonate aldolase (KDO 8-P synthase)